jgi:predicted Zn-dependent protease
VNSCVQQCRQETPHRIAFVMPYIESQTDKVLEAIAKWQEYLPFDAVNGHIREHCDLLFYYHKSKELHMSQYAHSRQAIFDAVRTATNDSRHNFLFENVEFMYADLSDADDRYPEGWFVSVVAH